jgi:hypothetical protein
MARERLAVARELRSAFAASFFGGLPPPSKEAKPKHSSESYWAQRKEKAGVCASFESEMKEIIRTERDVLYTGYAVRITLSTVRKLFMSRIYRQIPFGNRDARRKGLRPNGRA